MDQLVPLLIALFLFVLGAAVGSFLNVVIYRLPRGESIVHPGSHCPRCGRALTPADLAPILSWLLLRGRCRSCASRISPRYAGVELLTGLLFVAAGWTQDFTPTLELAHRLIVLGLFVPIFFIDQDHHIVPDELSAPLLVVGIVWNALDAMEGRPWLAGLQAPGIGGTSVTSLDLGLPTSLVYACICAGIFALIRWFGQIAFRKEAMGEGDVFIAAGVGANLPLLAALCSFAIAITVGAFVGLFLIFLRGRDRAEPLAFGPMLVIGAALMLLFPGPVYHMVEAYRASMHL